MDPTVSQAAFQQLKPICVPLLGSSSLTPSSTPNVIKLLGHLIDTLRTLRSSGHILDISLIKYTFFPISTILKRNTSSAISDQVLERILIVLSILCEDWWWECDVMDWEHIFMLCGSVLGGIETKGKGKERDDETKEAAAQCLFALLRRRDNEGGPLTPTQALSRMNMFKERAQDTRFVPILGQCLNAVLITAESRRLSLQKISLDLLLIMLNLYFPDDVIVSVLPGVVSTMCKIALGGSGSTGWTRGDVVAKTLEVMREVIVRSIGDEVCIRDGVIVSVEEIEELTELLSEPHINAQSADKGRYGTSRTPSWLRGTSSQLHIAIKTLSPLVKHSTPSALLALADFSACILRTTPTTMQQTQPLLLSYLLALFNSDYPDVSNKASIALLGLLASSSKAQYSLLQTLMRITRDNLVALPLLLPSHADAKVEHIAGIIEAVCRLASSKPGKEVAGAGLSSISSEIGRLLGPNGGIEKWGWSLLSVMEFVNPPVTITRTSAAQLMLENDPEGSQRVVFPQPTLKNVSSNSTYDALVRMFHALGQAAGDSGLSAVEWFVSVGQEGQDTRAVAGMWCACRLLEGISGTSLFSDPSTSPLDVPRSKRLEKLARGLARSTAQLWDEVEKDIAEVPPVARDEDISNPVQHVRGLVPLHETLKITRLVPLKQRTSSQPMLHKALSLQLISVTSSVLQAKFTLLLIYALYPILHGLVSPLSFLSETASAALNFVTVCASYATPANLLHSNFDYVLDSVSRRLTRRWLDVDATKVLAIMIRLVGNNIVERAGDVVEECFDRLDDFHGYEVIVEGLVQVLNEVINVIRIEEMSTRANQKTMPSPQNSQKDDKEFEEFFQWFAKRNDTPVEADDEDYGPAPRRAWGESESGDKGKGADRPDNADLDDSDREIAPTPSQSLTKQIVMRSMFFLTHGSPVIRARILALLGSSVPVLPESALMPSIHSAWPFILNRLGDSEIFVVSAAAGLVEALAAHMGGFMFRKIWDDVWPRFSAMLAKLEVADSMNALSRRGPGGVGTESVYTHSHRLYRSIIKTMTAALAQVDPQDASNWQVVVSFRRFLHSQASAELQKCARELYVAAARTNPDAVWLALYSTAGQLKASSTEFLHEAKWDIWQNVLQIFQTIEE